MGIIDLHTHSTASDGTLSPTGLINHAAAKGISVIALTDHDSTLGLAEAEQAAAQLPASQELIFIPGIELSAAYKSRDIHILGYCIDPQHASLAEIVRESLAERETRNHEMIELFRQHNIIMTMEELSADCPGASITRAHFARFLMEHGYVKTNNEAFAKYLGYNCPFYVPRKYITPENAVRAILDSGGVPVLAHPLLYDLSSSELHTLVNHLRNCGLKGIETFYSSNINNDEAFVRGIANKYGLIMTGGSDFHGSNKPQIEIGIGKGNLRVPAAVYENLKKACGRPSL